MDDTGEETNGAARNGSGQNSGADDTQGIESQQDDGDSKLRGLVRGAMMSVEQRAREKPMTMLAVASGLGFVIGGGLPRLRTLILLGGGGLVAGFGIPALRRRIAEAKQDDTESGDDPRESLDVGTGRSSGRHRRKKKRQQPAAGA